MILQVPVFASPRPINPRLWVDVNLPLTSNAGTFHRHPHLVTNASSKSATASLDGPPPLTIGAIAVVNGTNPGFSLLADSK